MQVYSDPARAHDANSLPNVETFKVTQHDVLCSDPGDQLFGQLCEAFAVHHDKRKSWLDVLGVGKSDTPEAIQGALNDITAEASDMAGWYWHSCFPGCLPDGDPSGPFKTEAEAIADAQNTEE